MKQYTINEEFRNYHELKYEWEHRIGATLKEIIRILYVNIIV